MSRAALVAALAAAAWGSPAAAAAAAAEPAVEAPPGERVVIADGHLDLGPRLVDGRWELAVRDDTVRPARWRDPDDVVVHVPGAARTRVPGAPEFAFLGRAGEPVWLLPQVQRAGLPWPGWNTQDPPVAREIAREVAWRLRGAEGPGRFALFVNGEFGAPEVVFDTGEPLPQETGIDADTHGHGNWTFGAPGAYALDMEMAARTRGGERRSARATVRLFVGAGDPAAAFDAPAPASAAAGAEGGAGDAADGGAAGGAAEEGDDDGAPGALVAGLVGAAVLAVGAALARLRRGARA